MVQKDLPSATGDVRIYAHFSHVTAVCGLRSFLPTPDTLKWVREGEEGSEREEELGEKGGGGGGGGGGRKEEHRVVDQ